MERITFSMTEDFADELNEFMDSNRYDNRSEALRDLARVGLARAKIDASEGECVATISYVFNYKTRQLNKRFESRSYKRSTLHIATMTFPLGDDEFLEIVILKGKTARVKERAKTVLTERGVLNADINLIPAANRTSGTTSRPAPAGLSQKFPVPVK
jgi:CopG family nickel-responsive transcriptional regulator